jgi:hypothetical protein
MKKKLMIFCIAVGLSLTLAAPSFAAITLNVDPTSLADGDYWGTTAKPAGIISTPYGDIIFLGQIRNSGDQDLAGKVFDVQDWDDPDPRNASLTFDFDAKYEVRSLTFSYGGNADSIVVEAWDGSSTLLDSFSGVTDDGDPIGPETFNAGIGNSIYKLTWKDPVGSDPQIKYDLASLNGITLEVIPAPGAILLGSIGVGFVGWLRRRRTL